MNEWTNVCMFVCMYVSMYNWMNEWMYGCTYIHTRDAGPHPYTPADSEDNAVR